ncbi:MAG: response regulator transcription factor [Deltaproteobacteria bacterium]|nr:MAG: response regulator transcription factor [Deltaproteobacteria bacterium]TMQ09621.1 MAG: response regulator transcription factor [Deltaproteobacteria bacterium]
MIRVFLVENELLVRKGLRSLLELEPELAIAGEASDGTEALAALAAADIADVVLLDLRMPRMGGLELLRELRRLGRDTPCLILTTFDDDDAVLDGIRAGARGYLRKDVRLEDLVDAIRRLARGETLIQPALTDRIRRGFAARSPALPSEAALLDPLTARELEVLRLMFGGYSNREIADACGVVEGTVKTHVSNILSKLGVRDRTRAVLRALEIGLL